jgi:uncharacterized protein
MEHALKFFDQRCLVIGLEVKDTPDVEVYAGEAGDEVHWGSHPGERPWWRDWRERTASAHAKRGDRRWRSGLADTDAGATVGLAAIRLATHEPARKPCAPSIFDRGSAGETGDVLQPRQSNPLGQRSPGGFRGHVQIGNDDDQFAHEPLYSPSGPFSTRDSRRQPMKLTLEGPSNVNLIRSYSADEIRIGEHHIRSSCIVTADTLIASWPPASIEDLQLSHLEAIIELRPELVLFGTGARQRFAPAHIRTALGAQGIGVEAMDLGAACRTFNILVQEERRVAAVLFLR